MLGEELWVKAGPPEEFTGYGVQIDQYEYRRVARTRGNRHTRSRTYETHLMNPGENALHIDADCLELKPEFAMDHQVEGMAVTLWLAAIAQARRDRLAKETKGNPGTGSLH